MKSILLDCDDVLLDWLSGYRNFASTHLGHEITGSPTAWNMGEWIGATDAVAVELLQEFNASDDFGKLAAVDGATEVVQELYNTGNRLHVITSCSSDKHIVKMRQDNLINVFGNIFDSIHCLDLSQSKIKLLQAWQPGAVWIEDNYKNALIGLQAGHSVLVRTRPHNIEYKQLIEPELKWFDDWQEVTSLLN